MPKRNVAMVLEQKLLDEVDGLVAAHEFSSRSPCIEVALTEALRRRQRDRLARECALLEPTEERALAEEWFRNAGDARPAY